MFELLRVIVNLLYTDWDEFQYEEQTKGRTPMTPEEYFSPIRGVQGIHDDGLPRYQY